jgi:peptidoglycan/LPS O-acetylase OafA/YrhL
MHKHAFESVEVESAAEALYKCCIAKSSRNADVTVPAHREKAHFLPLDSIRGIAAISVVIHHLILMPTFLAAFPHNAWINWSFFRSAWLLVDLFFVLSGIVMSLSYVKSDFGHFSLREFMVRRLARVYPLHIVMLFAALLFRLLRIGLVMAGVVVAMPATFEVNNAYSFVLNLFLLHSMGFIDYLSWNAPSWSISVEFYTYLVFGLVVLLAQRLGSLRYLYGCASLLVVASLLVIMFVFDKKSLGLQTDFGILRCIISFFLGVLTVKAVERLPRGIGPAWQGALQFVAMIASVVLVSLVEAYPAISFLAPFTFAVFLGSLLAFPDAVLVPKMLIVKPLVWLGKRSYSVYMVHALVVLVAEYFVRAVGPRPVAALDSICGGLAATLNLVVVLAAVLVVSHFTYRYVELPGSKLLRQIFGSTRDFSGSSAAPSARPSN